MSDRHGIAALLGDLIRAERGLSVLLSGDDLDGLLADGILRIAPAGARICEADGVASSVFLVLQGELREEGPSEQGVQPALGPGDVIGTAGILGDDEGASTVVAETAAILVQIPREIAGRVFERVPRLMQRLFERYRKRIVERTLLDAPVLVSLTPRERQNLVECATLAGYREGSAIVHTGDLGDTFHVMADGLAAIRHEIDGRMINLALARRGDYFGEWSLLTGAPRAATVTAMTRTITVGIDRETFLALVQESPSIQQRIDLEARNRFDRSTELRYRVESSDDVREKLAALEALIAERP